MRRTAGAVSTFCIEYNVSRSWFYTVRANAARNGTWKTLELGSTKPKGHFAQTSGGMIELILAVQAELKVAGFDLAR